MRCASSTPCSTNASSGSPSAERRSFRRSRFGAFAVLLASPLATPAAARDAPEPVASYTLSARLDGVAHVVTAHGTIELLNYTNVPLAELYFHLYMNAFKNDASLFLRSPFGAGRSGGHGSEWGYIDVKRLFARELGVELWPTRDPKSPGDPDDETDIRVPLPKPLEAGQKLTLDVEFELKLPQIIERTGYMEDYHFVAQWFPKLARLMPDGTFAHFAFHPQSEFAANFGRYDVTLDVPERDVVGATGVCSDSPLAPDLRPALGPDPGAPKPGRRLVRCLADGGDDFAWTSWRGFEQSW